MMNMSKKSEKLHQENLEENEEKSENVEETAGNGGPLESDEVDFTGENKRRNGERRENVRRQKVRRASSELDENSLEFQLKKVISEKDNEIMELNKEIESIKELIQRRQADFDNFKKRNLKLLEDNKKFAIRDFALDIININDDLLRAIEVSRDISDGESLEEAHNSFVEGVSMISGRIESTFNKFGITEIESLNLEFDPNLHEAVEIETADSVEFDTVTRVHQKGFRIEDLVVRSAKVKVTKPSGQSAGE
jgi:molecular chaperone GrpE